MSDNGNGKQPIQIIQLLIEKMELGIKNSQDRINDEIEDLTEAITSVVNRLNNTNKILLEKLDTIKSKVSKMILVSLIVFGMLTASVALSIFGSHLLYERNTKVFMEKMYEEYFIKHEETKHLGDITKKELKKIILDSLKELKEE